VEANERKHDAVQADAHAPVGSTAAGVNIVRCVTLLVYFFLSLASGVVCGSSGDAEPSLDAGCGIPFLCVAGPLFTNVVSFRVEV
jgi:hypothetical protein